MNKTVLFLINGLGIERKDSYNIYSPEVMPNFDKLTKEDFFTPISAPALNLEDAYKYFSIGTLTPLTTPYIENILDNNLFNTNPKFNDFHQSVFNCQGNIHFFAFLENDKVHDSIKKFIQTIDPEEQKKIYLHFILPQSDTSEYININKWLSRYMYDMPSNVVRGLVFGQEILENPDKNSELNDLVRMLYKGIGEKWKEVETKINSLYSLHIEPNDVKPFYINDGFVLGENDLFFFYNYDHYDTSRFINFIKNPTLYMNTDVKMDKISYYSLFPLTNKEEVTYLYDDVVSDISMAKAMEQVGATTLILTDKENVNMVNYMCNGLSNSSNSHIKYVLTDNGILYLKEQMRVILNDPSYQLIIINHRIDHIEDENTLKQELLKIDNNLAMIMELCKDKTLLVSSLFGVKKDIKITEIDTATINFSGRVPVILIDSRYDNKKYRMSSADTYTLFTTALKCMKPELKVNSLIKKKSFIETLLNKKK